MGRYTDKDHHDAHNKGQADGAENDYKPPVPLSPLDDFVYPEETLKEWRELNESYKSGWENGYKTR
jgi:hypothetical protein